MARSAEVLLRKHAPTPATLSHSSASSSCVRMRGALVVSHHSPFFRKQASKVQQQLADLDRKEADYRRAAAASSQAFLSACKELGIQVRVTQ